MKTKTLAWYIAVMLALTALMASAISYAPEAQTFGYIISAGSCLAAATASGVAIWISRMPARHRTHSSKSINRIFVALAIVVMIFAAALG